MTRLVRSFAALAQAAWLGCAPAASPASEPAAAPLPASSRADAAASTTLAPEDVDGLLTELPNPPASDDCPTKAPRDAECRPLLGSPADVHTPEGAFVARGYEFHRHCTSYYQWGDVGMAVVGTGRIAIPHFPPWVPRSIDLPRIKQEFRDFWVFAEAVRRAAGVPSLGAKADARCSEPEPRTVVLKIRDWRQVDQAVHNLGEWLAKHDLKGEIILWPQANPGPPIPL